MGAAARRRWPAAAAAVPPLLLLALLLPSAVALSLPGVGEKSVLQSDPHVRELNNLLEDLRETLEDEPRNFKALLQKGVTLARLNVLAPDGGKRVPEALEALRTALDMSQDPQVRAFVLTQLGELLVTSRFFKEAVSILGKTEVLAAKSGLNKTETYAEILIHLAKAEQALGNPNRAHALFERALERARTTSGPTYARSWLGLASFSEKQLKELEDCAEFLRRRWEGVSEEELSDAEADEWFDLQERWTWLEGLQRSKRDTSCVHFAHAAAMRQEGRHEEMWQALGRANGMRGSIDPYDRKNEADNAAALLELFKVPKPPEKFENETDMYWAALISGHWGYRDPSLRPIYLIGLPRSGAALVDQILLAHSQVGSTGMQSTLLPQLQDLLELLSTEGEVPTANITAAGNSTVAALRRAMADEKPAARWVVDRFLPNIWNVGFIAITLPDACIVHVTRHPADQGLSCYEHPFDDAFTTWSFKLKNIAHQMDLMQQVADHWDTVVPGRILHIHYEDLVRKQEATTRRILDHCGIPWEDAVLKPKGPQGLLKLHTGSMQRFRAEAPRLVPLLRPLRNLIARYERDAGLESSEEFLEKVVGPDEEEEEEEGAVDDEVSKQQEAQQKTNEASSNGVAGASGSGSADNTAARDEL